MNKAKYRNLMGDSFTQVCLRTFCMAVVSAFLTVNAKALAGPAESPLSLMPYPRQLVEGRGNLAINSDFSVEFTGYRSDRLETAKNRLFTRIERHTGIFLERKPATGKPATLTVFVERPPQKPAPSVRDDESYHLEVNEKNARLHATSPYGALRGLETFLQLIAFDNNGQVIVPAVTIADSPQFKWRGLLIDSARHFISVNAIKRQLDGMASAKYNVFHWHLTDDQGWRIESKQFPKLHRLGAGGQYYTQEEIRGVVDYATLLGIRVVPEFDFPGHASAIAVAYPELMSAAGPYEAQTRWGVHEPTLNPANKNVYVFIDKLVEEMTTLFPDEYIHIGGDEVNPKHWSENRKIQAFMESKGLKDYHQLQAYFNRKLNGILKKHGRKMVGWDEIFHPDLPKSIVIQSWRGPESLAEAAQKGYAGILSAGYYLDQPQASSYHYRNHPIHRDARIDDMAATGESWQSWRFEMPRRKGGAVQGTFTLITSEERQHRGFIDINGKSRRALLDINISQDTMGFWLDTWMGKTSFKLKYEGDRLGGIGIVANGQYMVTGERIVASEWEAIPKVGWPAVLTPEQELLVLGGEAALWSELVSEEVIDLKLWPRAYVVAERLWSDKNLNDEENMYHRLNAVSRWSILSVNLQHEWQAFRGLKRLANGADPQPLQILAEAVEQAQYYHRHHEKYLAGKYHQYEPLNKFADALPAESLHVRLLDRNVSRLIGEPANPELMAAVTQPLVRWRDNHQQLMDVIGNSGLLKDIAPIAKLVHEITELGLMCINALRHGEKLSSEEIEPAYLKLQHAKQIYQELVVSSAYPIERLLGLCR